MAAIDGSSTAALTRPFPAGSTAGEQDASFSPDGTHIVFVFTNFDDSGKVTDEIRSVRTDGSDVRTLFKPPATGPALFFGYPRYSLDGTSLTVNRVEADIFSVLLIPHTLRVTTWGERRLGDEINLEVDLMARYAARLSGTLSQKP